MAARFHPDLYRQVMGYPEDRPDLQRLRPPGGNARPDGVADARFMRRAAGNFSETY